MAITTAYSFRTTLDETIANTFIGGTQYLPAVTGLSNGGYVVAYNNASTSAGYILLDFYSPAGTVQGAFRLAYDNSGLTSAIGQPSIIELTNGNVVVAWDENRAGEQSIKASLFTPDGTTIIRDADLTGPSASFETPDITPLTNGTFVLTYAFEGNTWAGIYNSSMIQLGSFFQVNSTSSANQVDPVVVGLKTGGFAVTYVDDSGGSFKIFTRTYDATGLPVSNPILIDAAGNNGEPAVAALNNGNYVVVYTDSSLASENGTDGISMKIINQQGNVISSHHVNVPTPALGKNEAEPDVTVLENGFIVVSWTYPFSGSDHDIYAKVFDQNGTQIPLNGSYSDKVISGVSADTVASSVASLLSGNFVTVWQDETTDGFSGRISREQSEITRFSTGDALANTIIGDSLDDVIVGNAGNDWLEGRGGNDWIYGGDGNDHIVAGNGAIDVSVGNAGADKIFGQGGFDYIYGYADNDLLYGGDDTDVVYGGEGNDLLMGNTGTDWLYGENGNDSIFGEDDADLIFGGAGNDFIKAGTGNDWTWGGSEADQFAFDDGWGVDIIYDFEDGIDSLDLSGTSASGFADITVGQIIGSFTWFAYGSNVVYLWGMDGTAPGAANITASDFIF